MVKEPMLAAKLEPKDLSKLSFPLYGSPKIDGIRGFSSESKMFSRKLKLLPNHYVQQQLATITMHGLDGELTVGEPNHELVCTLTTSGVMSRDGEPVFTWWVFDDYTAKGGFVDRHRQVIERVKALRTFGYPVRVLPHTRIDNLDQLLAFEEKCIEAGLEGVCLRSEDGPYKQGRSTLREGYLMKLKRFVDGEALILDYEELKHNDNEAQINELGRTKRSSHKANKRGGGTMGSLKLRTIPGGVDFRAGGGKGMTAKLRDYLWSIREQLPGQIVTYTSFPVGVKDRPRQPKLKLELSGPLRVKGLRHPDDMSDDQVSNNPDSTSARGTKSKR